MCQLFSKPGAVESVWKNWSCCFLFPKKERLRFDNFTNQKDFITEFWKFFVVISWCLISISFWEHGWILKTIHKSEQCFLPNILLGSEASSSLADTIVSWNFIKVTFQTLLKYCGGSITALVDLRSQGISLEQELGKLDTFRDQLLTNYRSVLTISGRLRQSYQPVEFHSFCGFFQNL